MSPEPTTTPASAPAPTTEVDVVVLGSGIGGSTVAALLARSGVRVALVDSARHPRFALGESTIGETSFLLRQLAARYDVPELAHVSTSAGLAEHVSARCGIKRNFGFVYQRAGQQHAPYEVTQCNVSAGPFGPESHLMRADVDQYLFDAAVRYGALAREGVRVQHVHLGDDAVAVELADGEVIGARYVVDATGRQSVLANQLGLREEPCRFATASRTIFTHMRGVRRYDDVDAASGQPSPWHEGTLHHLFDGGWMWVIPFDNHDEAGSDLVSVGLNLDLRSHPVREGVPVEQEWAEFLAAHPTVAAQFADAEPVFPWISTGRTQFSSSRTVGDRWALMSHAAGAIDALFSRGMANTMAVVEAFVPTLLAGLADGDLSAERFAYVDTLNQAILDNNDKLIAGSYTAFRDFDLWRAWSKMWYLAWNLGVIRIAGSYYRYLETREVAELDRLHRAALPGTFCPELASAQEQFDACYEVVLEVERGETTPADAVPRLAFLLGDGEASPSPLNLHDVLRRWHDGSAETQKLIHDWGRTAAPEALRPYFAYDRATIDLAARQVLGAGRPAGPDVVDLRVPAQAGAQTGDAVRA
ncbi:NAD(P)/FAD-dependent oxidoreductase [Quadrisphaera sp. DSM 44207]|uniref:NAD(P)/FAD-dependent oxidoreductase n=1 Tax=Quadrisphaera sp. DSM 44207 TaxID=1881057 RepID=UPI000884AF15|nr:NAD(P)/FAD-dependent oxidoreductase [Quadrisphaera sp. DSM 44207]SDQ22286.1 FADH2 O2-dependent halogenase [Quadrisphaera sp. DSM 44207]